MLSMSWDKNFVRNMVAAYIHLKCSSSDFENFSKTCCYIFMKFIFGFLRNAQFIKIKSNLILFRMLPFLFNTTTSQILQSNFEWIKQTTALLIVSIIFLFPAPFPPSTLFLSSKVNGSIFIMGFTLFLSLDNRDITDLTRKICEKSKKMHQEAIYNFLLILIEKTFSTFKN